MIEVICFYLKQQFPDCRLVTYRGGASVDTDTICIEYDAKTVWLELFGHNIHVSQSRRSIRGPGRVFVVLIELTDPESISKLEEIIRDIISK